MAWSESEPIASSRLFGPKPEIGEALGIQEILQAGVCFAVSWVCKILGVVKKCDKMEDADSAKHSEHVTVLRKVYEISQHCFPERHLH